MSPVRIPGLISAVAPLSPGLDADVSAAAKAALDAEPLPPSKFRVAPDLTFEVELDDGTWRRFELVSDGAFLRDPETRRLWPFGPGKALLTELAPVRWRGRR